MTQKICYTNTFLDLHDRKNNVEVLNRLLVGMQSMQSTDNDATMQTNNANLSYNDVSIWVNWVDYKYMYEHYRDCGNINLFVKYKNNDGINVFIHCRPKEIPNKTIILFANLKQYADLLCCSRFLISHLYQYNILPHTIRKSCQQIKYMEKPNANIVYVPDKLASPKSWGRNSNEIITFRFDERPTPTNVEGIPLYIINYDQLLDFKRFLVLFIHGKENVKWAINENQTVIDCLFKVLVDEEHLIYNYFPSYMPNYWFAIPRCKDYRSNQLRKRSDQDEKSSVKITTYKLFELISRYMFTSYLRPYYNPIHNGLILYLLQCDSYHHNDHLYKHKGFGYEQYNITGTRII